MEIFGMKIHGVKDIADALPKMRHVSGGPKARYSYGGVRDLARKRFPHKQPYPQGAYMLLENLPKADSIVDNRPRVRERFVGKDVVAQDFFGKQVVSLEAYAEYRGYSLSNVRKVFYDLESGFADLFTVLHGGFLFDEAEFQDLVAWIQEFGSGPRPKRARRPMGHRTKTLNTDKTNAAKRVGNNP